MIIHNNSVNELNDSELVAVIGLGCRFPGAENIHEYWQLLLNGHDAISEVPAERWDAHQYYDPDITTPGKMNTRWGGFLKQVDGFDPFFFGISPREAIQLDPQQRLMLEVSWEALADAGQDSDKLRESETGVFYGASWADYATLNQKDGLDYIAQHTATGSHFSIIANRVSYAFGFRGPSMTVDTACSSSLVAVHLACQSLLSGEATLALAGGVHLMLAPDSTMMMSKFGGLSPDGRCRAFDARANGFVRGEGAGVVVLKPLSQALADKDPIYCVIRGSAVNNDGRETGMSAMQRIVTAVRGIRQQRRAKQQVSHGLTVPSTAAQEAVLAAACRRAGLPPDSVQYVEAHGTGTPLGDPIEARALSTVYCEGRSTARPLILGSVKTNIGHLEAAAGVAGLIKVALAIKEGIIPATLHFEKPNPNIPFDTLNLKVQTKATPWPNAFETPVAGVSSFGFGGTNCHILLAGLPPADNTDNVSSSALSAAVAPALLLPLSARTAEARQDVAKNFLSFVETHPDISLPDVCYTASQRCSHHAYRLTATFEDREGLLAQLKAFVQGEEAGIATGQTGWGYLPKPVFVFSGQGPQWWRMGRELFAQEPVFRAVIEECNQLLKPYADWSLITELMAAESASRLSQTAVAQPAIYALQVALAALWQSWGIEPGAVVGHSLGEVAAATACGSLTLAQGIQIIFHRGRLMQAATGQGKMAAIDLSAEQAHKLINSDVEQISVAAVNGPDAVTLSGEITALDSVLAHCEEAGIFYRRLEVDYAFHSPQMAPYQKELVQILNGLTAETATVPMFSTVTGNGVNGDELDADYWGRNLRNTVLFDEAINALIGEGFQTFIELSPHPVLSRYISQRLAASQKTGRVLPSLRRGQPERLTMLASVGALYVQGYSVAWEKVNPAEGQVVSLPAYPWQRERYWLPQNNGSTGVQTQKVKRTVHPLLGERLRSPLMPQATVFESHVNLGTHTFLDDHRLYQAVVAPGAYHISTILLAVQMHLGVDTCQLTDITFTKPLTLTSEDGRYVQVILQADGSDAFNFEIHSCPAEEEAVWTLHVSGQVVARTPLSPTFEPPADTTEIQSRCSEEVPGTAFYRDFTAAGYHLGSRFQWLHHIWRQDGEALCQLRQPQPTDQVELFQLHPGLIDSLFQFLCVTLPGGGVTNILHSGDIYIPLGIDSFHFYGRPQAALWCQAKLRPQENGHQETFVGDVWLFDENGQIVVEVSGLHFKRAPQDILLRSQENEKRSWFYRVEWRSKGPETAAAQPLAGNWLVFSNGVAHSQDLLTALTAQNQNVFLVSPGDHFKAVGQQAWQINPGLRDDFVRLLAELPEQKLDHIVYLWGLENTPATTLADIEAWQNHACQGALYLVQAVARQEGTHLLRLWLVTQGAVSVLDDDTAVAVAQAPLWGLGRVIALEHPEMWGGLIDLEQPKAETAAILTHIIANDGEDQAAFRQGKRYVARLSQCNHCATAAENLPIRPDGSYLITGGLGGLGLTVAKWLAAQGAQHIVLTSRRQSSPQSKQTLDTLKEMGATVSVIPADVSQADQVEALIGRIEATLPALRGVIHAAGILHDGILLHQEWSRFAQVMAPKIAGAWHLHTQTQDHPLDFFILFSSIASLLGSAGQGNYAAANAFMDTLSHARRLQGLPALSVNWGPWADVGMVNNLNEQQKMHWRSQGFEMIPAIDGTNLMAQAQNQDVSQIGIFPVNWRKFSQQPTFRNGWAFLSDHMTAGENGAGHSDEASKLLQRLEEASPDKQKELLLAHVRQQAVQVLGIGSPRRLDPHKRLFEIGMDSLMAVDLQKRLQRSLAIRLSKTLVFDYPTVQSLTNYLLKAVLGVVETEAAETEDRDFEIGLQKEIAELSEEEAEALLLAELGD